MSLDDRGFFMLSYKQFEFDEKYFFAGFVCFLIIMSRWLLPEFIENESIYSVHPIKLLDSNYLINDLFLGGISYYTLIFSAATMPLYALFDPLIAVMIIRCLIWIFQLWALAKLSKTLGLKWWSFIIFILLFINTPFKIAGEWIIGSAASKPLAYGFIFLSLDALLKNHVKKAGIFTGIAVSLHILVGGWSASALFLTIIINCLSNKRYKDIIYFGLYSFILSMPGFIPALLRVFGVIGKKTLEVNSTIPIENSDKIYVTFANPFHLDPSFFIQGGEIIKVIIVFFAPILLYKIFLKKEYASTMNKYLLILTGVFIVGVIAGKLEFYKFIKYYPFRVADGLLPLNLWIGFSLLVQSLFKKFKYNIIMSFAVVPFMIIACNYLIDVSEPSRRYKDFRTLVRHTEPRETPYRMKDTLIRLYDKFVNGKKDSFEEIAGWIYLNTPKDAIFITPPIKYEFALIAQRAQIVTYKCVPVNKKVILWKHRMEDLNGGKFKQEGKNWMYKELKINYPKLEENAIRDMKNKYNAEFILTTNKEYKGFDIIYENELYTLYRIT